MSDRSSGPGEYATHHSVPEAANNIEVCFQRAQQIVSKHINPINMLLATQPHGDVYLLHMNFVIDVAKEISREAQSLRRSADLYICYGEGSETEDNGEEDI